MAQVKCESKPVVANDEEWELVEWDSKLAVAKVQCEGYLGELDSKLAAAKVQCEINSAKLDSKPVAELVREDTPPAHYEIGHLRYKAYALHVTVLWVNAQTVRIPVACLEIVGGVTLMRTYVLASDTNANYLARACFDVLAFVRLCVRLCVLAFVRAFARPGPGD
jgi:hypothetical protein